MKTELFISRRLGLRAEGSRRTSAGVSIAVTGIAIAMVVMMISIAVVIGFKQEIRSKVSGFDSQIMLYPSEVYDPVAENPGIRLSDTLRSLITSAVPQAHVSLAFKRPAIFKTDSAFQGIVLKGMDSSEGNGFIASNMETGSMPHPDSLNQVAISSSTANALNVKTGDKLMTHFLHNGNLRTRALRITGIYNTHFSDYDNVFAFTPIAMLQRLSHTDSITGSSVEIRGLDDADVDAATAAIRSAILNDMALNPGQLPTLAIDNVHHTGASYFTWISLLDTNVVVILTLMAVVSGFTLVSSLFILILERVRMIGLLKALGATNGFVRRIFIYMAQRIVIRGILIGNIAGIVLLLLQMFFHIVPLDADAYYLDYVPVKLELWWLLLLNAGVIVISWLILILPSQIVATLSPARSMRYE